MKEETLEEKAGQVAHECALSGPEYMYHALRTYFLSLILPALHEVVEEAQVEDLAKRLAAVDERLKSLLTLRAGIAALGSEVKALREERAKGVKS